MINFWLTNWVPSWGQIFLKLFHTFTFLPVNLNLAYFAPLNGASRSFPVNFNYQRCLENCNMINFWLTSWVPSWWQIFFISFHFFTFLPVTLNLAYFAPLNGASRSFPLNFNYQRCLENYNMINFWLTSWDPLWWQIFFSFFTFLPVTLNLAYFAPLNGAGRIFPVNFNYQRCLKNSNTINFWLTSWVTLWWQIFLVFSLFAPDKSQ